MPISPNRMYRDMTQLLTIVPEERKKRLDTSYYVEGYATTFDEPYLLWDTGETKYFEKIDKKAFKNADMSDVIFQYNHQGRVYARNSNNTLGLEVDKHGLFVFADLSRTEGAKDLYGDIAAGMITKMSWAFTRRTPSRSCGSGRSMTYQLSALRPIRIQKFRRGR